MSDNHDAAAPESAPLTAHEKLLALVEKRKAEAGQVSRGIPGQRRTEKAAAHRSLSKSKPAPTSK